MDFLSDSHNTELGAALSSVHAGQEAYVNA